MFWVANHLTIVLLVHEFIKDILALGETRTINLNSSEKKSLYSNNLQMYCDKQNEAERTEWNIMLLFMTEDNTENSTSLELNQQLLIFFLFIFIFFFLTKYCRITWTKLVEISEILDLFICKIETVLPNSQTGWKKTMWHDLSENSSS